MKFEAVTFADLDYLATEEIKKLMFPDGIARLLVEDNLSGLIENDDKYKVIRMRDKKKKLRGWSILVQERNNRLGLASIHDGIYMCFIDERLRGYGFAEVLWIETLEAYGCNSLYSVIAHDDISRGFYTKLQDKYPDNIHINHWGF